MKRLLTPLFAVLCFATMPGFSVITAPWRKVRQVQFSQEAKKTCPICTDIFSSHPEYHLILKKNARSVIMMNPKPYTLQATMISPYAHTGDITLISEKTWIDMWQSVREVVEVYKKMGITSYNIGMNLGTNGGGSLKDHLHIHVVPRYSPEKETRGFMEILAHTEIFTEYNTTLYKKMLPYFKGK